MLAWQSRGFSVGHGVLSGETGVGAGTTQPNLRRLVETAASVRHIPHTLRRRPPAVIAISRR
jgi:hypothetical protein